MLFLSTDPSHSLAHLSVHPPHPRLNQKIVIVDDAVLEIGYVSSVAHNGSTVPAQGG